MRRLLFWGLIFTMLAVSGCVKKEKSFVDLSNPKSVETFDSVAREFLEVYFDIDNFALHICEPNDEKCVVSNYKEINIRLSPFVSDDFTKNIKESVDTSPNYGGHILDFFCNDDVVILDQIETSSLIGEGGIGSGIMFQIELIINGEPVSCDGYFWFDGNYKIKSMRMRLPDEITYNK
ncbi:hypothetical protein RI065_08500 [Mycoplasmatota bacterium zrk1]